MTHWTTALLLGALATAGCGVETEEVAAPRLPAGAGGGSGSGSLTFSGDIDPIFQSYCLRCHSASSPSGGVDASSYDGLIASGVLVPGDPDSSLVLDVLEGGAMPPPGQPGPGLSEISAIRDWIVAGALNN